MASDMGLMEEPVSRRAGVCTPFRLTFPKAKLGSESALDSVIRMDLQASGAACSSGEQEETTVSPKVQDSGCWVPRSPQFASP